MTSFRIDGREITDQEITNLLGNYYYENKKVYINNLYKRASVLLLLIQEDDKTSLLYTRRTERVLDHKGQVSFPGGTWEPQDLDDVDTALRETNEEIGVEKNRVTILGQLPEMDTITHYLISPIVGWIKWQEQFMINPQEVERVFMPPISWLINRENSTSQRLLVRDGIMEKVLIFNPYEGEVIWGITARLTCRLFRALGIV